MVSVEGRPGGSPRMGPEAAPPREARAALQGWRAETRRSPYHRTRLLRLILGQHRPELLSEAEDELREFGEQVGGELDELAAIADRDENLPRLAPRDGLGLERQEVEFHPAYHQIGERVHAARLMSDYGSPGREMLQLGKYFLLTHLGESGHLCPLACTAGLIKLLQAKGSPQLQERYLPGLLEPDYARKLLGAQFVTEVQGGSDAGTNSASARPLPGEGERFSVTGEKWFCSVVHADLFLVTARVEGQREGTRGLGCFLVPRRLPGGQPNGFRIHRIKGKVGTRAFPTAEVSFEGAVGYPVGDLEEGFKNVVGTVLHTSRLYNAIGCAGAASRAYLDAHAYARHRRAFGRPILEFPPVARTLAGMKARAWAIAASTFHLVALSERVEAGQVGPSGAAALRCLTNMNKYFTSVQNTRVAIDGVEVLGGNGTIVEFSILPQLYRLGVVLESWEGTHNVLCAQVLRDALRYDMDRASLAEVWAILDACPEGPLLEDIAERLQGIERELEALREVPPEVAGDRIRPLVDRFMVAFQGAALLALSQHERAEARTTEALAVLQHFLALHPARVERRPALDGVEACLVPA